MSNFDVNIFNCDREPIHIPGTIQSHGCLLACDPSLEYVLRHSVNVNDKLSLADMDPKGATLSSMLGEELAHRIRNGLSRVVDPRRPALLFDCGIRSSPSRWDISVHAHQDVAIVEFESSQGPDSRALAVSRDLIARAQAFQGIKELFSITPRMLRAALGYDRVMIYKFAADGSGKVIAEAKRRDLESFSGQHFPAADIPQQARLLYIRNTIRVVGDAHDVGVRINPLLDAAGAPLDLTYAHLRSVSPIHLEYLRNMGVAASMSLSIIVDGKLWGLIACHNYERKSLPLPDRVAAETFAEFLSLRVEAFERTQTLEAATEARRKLDGLLQATASHADSGKFLFNNLTSLKELIPCAGAGVFIDGEWRGVGVHPSRARVAAIGAIATELGNGRVWSTHELSKSMSGAEDLAAEVSGVIAVPLSQLPRDYLFFFRPEQVRTLNWGGDPNKVYRSGPNGDRLSPRKSFEIWKQTVERQSEPWSEIDLQTAEAARIQLLEIMMRHSEVLAKERREADIRQKTLNEELNHRVKNILALIKSLASQEVGPDQDAAAFASVLKGRIIALANAHDQVVRSDGGGMLADLARAELGPYVTATRRIEVDGPPVSLGARAYSVLALVLHELATNAAKYGSLSVPDGRLSAAWRVLENGDCELSWRETGGPPVVKPKRSGFGSALIRRSVPFDLGGETEISYLPDGVSARLLLPAIHVESRSGPDARADAKFAEHPEAGPALAGLRVLLLEDQFVIALDAENILKENGAVEVDLTSTLDEAMRALEAAQPDFAVLDVNLGRVTSLGVADYLADHNIPFVFATGYGDSSMISARHKKIPVVRKPYNSQSLIGGIMDVLKK